MIAVYGRSLCQSYFNAYRRGIVVCECETVEDAMAEIEAWTCDSFNCFAVEPDGTVRDLTGTYPQLLAKEMGL